MAANGHTGLYGISSTYQTPMKSPQINRYLAIDHDSLSSHTIRELPCLDACKCLVPICTSPQYAVMANCKERLGSSSLRELDEILNDTCLTRGIHDSRTLSKAHTRYDLGAKADRRSPESSGYAWTHEVPRRLDVNLVKQTKDGSLPRDSARESRGWKGNEKSSVCR